MRNLKNSSPKPPYINNLTYHDAARYDTALFDWSNEMAAFVPALNTVRVAVEMTQRGHLTANIYHVQSPHAIASIDLSTIGALFVSWMTTSILPNLTDGLALYNVNLRDLTTSTSLIHDTPVSPPVTGGHVGGEVSNNVALVGSWRTGVAGRSFRGRTYIPALWGSGFLTVNETTAAYAALFATAFTSLQTQVVTAGYELVVASFRHAGAPRLTAVMTPPTSVIVNTLVDTQRRRMKGSS